jgi:hypothetical protein
MTEQRAVGALGALLAGRRRRRFVGRAAEVELFRTALRGESPFSVLHLHGPGGIGKTSLLDVYAELALDDGATVVRLDARELAPVPDTVLGALGAGDDDTPVPRADRLVLLLDTYERWASLDDWLRTRLLPRLPDTALLVLAGREPPRPAWRADPAWHELLRVVALRNLGVAESRRYLQECDVDPALHERIVAGSHGHPLGLSLLADVALRGGDAVADPLAPDLVGTLLHRFVEVVPSSLHRRALEVCALARVTTEGLLRDALEVDDAQPLFAWLRGLSFVEPHPDGLHLHDLARDALDADLRWRDPDGYRRVFRRVRAHLHAGLASTTGLAQQRVLFDEKFLFRHLPGILSPVDWETWGRFHAEPACAGDRRAMLDIVGTGEGPEAAAVAEHWLDRQPDGFFVLRQDGRVTGVVGLLNLTRATPADIAADPGTAAAWDFAHRHAPPRPGDVVTQTRFVVDAAAYQGPSAVLNAVPILTLQRYLATPALSWDFLTLAEPDRWNEYFAVADLPRADGADFTVGGRRFGLFAHDFRRVPVDAWLELVTERALARDVTLAPAARPAPLVLSQQEFDGAVRQALRDLRRPDLLARNPLVRTRLLQDPAGGAATAAALESLVRDAAGALREDPRDDKLWRAVERTYLRPTATQEAAAAALGLPFSTYRRHLTQGVARVVATLWEREVYGEQ